MLRCEAIGRLTDNPNFRTVEIGGEQVPVAEFCLAVNLGYGERQTTEFINCVVWRKQAEVVRDHLSKGRKIYVFGRSKNSRYTANKDGVEFTQNKTEWILDGFEFCDSVPGKGQQADAPETPAPGEEEAPF